MGAANQIRSILEINTFQISAVIFFVSIIIIAISMMLNKKDEDREKVIKQILALVTAAFIVISATAISGKLNGIIGKMTIAENGSTGQESDVIGIEEQEEKGFWEKGIDRIFGYVADAAETAKKYLLGTDKDVGIRAILQKATANPIADYNVPTKIGGTLNLFTVILNGTSFLTFLMVINTACKLMKFSWNPSKREEVIVAFSKWAYVIVFIAALPGLFAASTKIMDIMMGMFSNIDLDYTLNMSADTDLVKNGIVWSILRIAMAFVEFKIYVLMIYRRFVINAYYLTSPIAIYLWGVSDNFTAANGWLNGILTNVFSPIAYEITFILAVTLIKVFYPGNVIASFFTVLFAVTIADAIKGIINYRISGNVLGGVQDVKNVTRGIFATTMTAITLARLGKGIANSKLFRAPDPKIPPASGKTFPEKEKTTFQNRNTTQNNAKNKAEQLGKTNISNKGSASSNQSKSMDNRQFSQSNQLGKTSRNNINENVKNSAPINKSNKTDNVFPGQIKENVLHTDSGIAGQPELKNQNRDFNAKNSFDTGYSGTSISSENLKIPNEKSSKVSKGNSVNIDSNLRNRPKVVLGASELASLNNKKMYVHSDLNSLNKNQNRNQNPNALHIKDGISKVKNGIQTVAKGAPAAAGVGVTIATGNPILGYAASKGTRMAVNATENIIRGGTNAVKNTVGVAKSATNLTKNTVEKVNKAIKSNSDFKAYRRN